MCLLERRRVQILPLDMTLTTQILPHNLPHACVNLGVPISHRPEKTSSCGTCHRDIHVTITQYCSCNSPITPQSPILRYPHSYTQTLLYTPLSIQYKADLRILKDIIRGLRISGWYYEGQLDWMSAKSMLKDSSVGAFLLRNSADQNFLFSLSIQTEKGPTSVRIHYENGYFWLDCAKSLAKYMPRFRGIIDLIQHYIKEGGKGPSDSTVWVDLEGCPHSHVYLKQAVKKKPSSLQHLSRLAIHKAIDSNPLTPNLWNAPKHRHLPLPSSLLEYLNEYPYSV